MSLQNKYPELYFSDGSLKPFKNYTNTGLMPSQGHIEVRVGRRLKRNSIFYTRIQRNELATQFEKDFEGTPNLEIIVYHKAR